MHRHLRKIMLAVMGSTVVGLCTSRANAAAALWISAPTWSYSGAVASTSFGTFYAWYLNATGPGATSYAYAYSVGTAPPGAAYAFAAAAAGNGGVCGVDVAGVADPFADIGVGISLDPTGLATEPSLTIPSGYTVSDSGITFTGNDEYGGEMNGDEKIEAFLYTGDDTDSALQGELGISSDNNGVNPANSSGQVDAFSGLGSDFVSLDNPFDDKNGLAGITFNQTLTNAQLADVILVGESDAVSTPTPAALPGGLLLLGLGGTAYLLHKRRTA